MSGFRVLMMEFPLRNTKEVIKLADLDSNNASRTATIAGWLTSDPSYSLSPNLMSGVQCQQSKVNIGYYDAELSRALEVDAES